MEPFGSVVFKTTSLSHSPFRMWSAQLAATTSDLTATIIGSMQYRVLAPIPGTAPGNL